MSDYWEYLKKNFSNPLYWTPGTFVSSAYETLYENSHGDDRYWLSKVPILSTWKKYKDESQKAEDTYRNTGKDPAYITSMAGFSGASLGGDVGAGQRAVGMARSLSDVYSPEVIEDVAKKFNGSYR